MCHIERKKGEREEREVTIVTVLAGELGGLANFNNGR
jgi:hypothetical protein